MTRRRSRTASLRHEREYYAQGVHLIFGLDEVGRGAWAGPVTVGTVCLPLADPKNLSRTLAGVRDSKEMTPRQRETLVKTIKDIATVWGIGSASNIEIDKYGINAATKIAMKRALEEALRERNIEEPDALFLDSLLWPEMRHIPQVSLVDGDKRSLSIAAASVLAKTWRDDVMRDLDDQYPHYGFAANKGYGTAVHQSALREHGPSTVHRKCYRPVQDVLPSTGEDS
jgi:ribonuclease HII